MQYFGLDQGLASATRRRSLMFLTKINLNVFNKKKSYCFSYSAAFELHIESVFLLLEWPACEFLLLFSNELQVTSKRFLLLHET